MDLGVVPWHQLITQVLNAGYFHLNPLLQPTLDKTNCSKLMKTLSGPLLAFFPPPQSPNKTFVSVTPRIIGPGSRWTSLRSLKWPLATSPTGLKCGGTVLRIANLHPSQYRFIQLAQVLPILRLMLSPASVGMCGGNN